jgi:hypothetical protein
MLYEEEEAAGEDAGQLDGELELLILEVVVRALLGGVL